MLITDWLNKILKFFGINNKSNANNLIKTSVQKKTLETSNIISQIKISRRQKNKRNIIFNKITTPLDDVSRIINKRSVTQLKRKKTKKGINITA